MSDSRLGVGGGGHAPHAIGRRRRCGGHSAAARQAEGKYPQLYIKENTRLLWQLA